jgi:hypothetical protein
MKRCTSCFRYATGRPNYCPYCGRTYNVRLCPRGHASPRNVQFCSQCGSDDLSTAAAPESWSSWLSHWTLKLSIAASLVLFILTISFSFVMSLDWSALTPAFLRLTLVLGLLYWTTTLLPGPVKRVGKAAGRKAWRAIRNQGWRP